MINNLKIENFRGLESININLAPFTLIAGANNVGKTSVLEALFLLYGHRSPLVFNQLLSFRNAHATISDAYDLWENIFHKYNTKNKLCILTSRNGSNEVLEIVNDNDYEIAQEPTRIYQNIKLPASSLGSVYPLRVSYKYNDEETRFLLSIESDADGVCVSIKDKRGSNDTNAENTPIVSYAGDRFQNPQYLYDLLGKINRNKQKEVVVNALKGIDNRVNDIILGDKQQVYIDISGLSEAIPLSFLGSGVSNVLYWASLIIGNSAKILLIDEIENGIHFMSMQEVMKSLCEIGKAYDCQIIATTHSIDCVNSFSKCPNDRIGYIRLDRHPESGTITPVEIDAKVLPDILMSDWEVQ